MERAHGPVARRMFDQLRLAPGAWFLDIGCGNGYSVRWAAERAPQGRAVGIDASPNMVARARELSRDWHNAEFHQAVFPHHALPAGSFDVVFSVEAFYYMGDVVECLREALRVLKPGGICISGIDYFRENPESRGWSGYVGARMRRWGEKHWARAFERAGFASVAQDRLVVPASEAVEPWHASIGSLVTQGVRPATTASP
jgi:ubiquinone/menaquinone biosynthesis C-methylase UbiE